MITPSIPNPVYMPAIAGMNALRNVLDQRDVSHH
jgi:hypothetical protein